MDDAPRFEPNDRYAELIGRLNPPSFGGIRSIAYQLLNENYSTAEINAMYDDLQHGTRVLDREELLWRYPYAFGPKHIPLADVDLSYEICALWKKSKQSQAVTEFADCLAYSLELSAPQGR